MVDFSRFKRKDGSLTFRDGVFVIIGIYNENGSSKMLYQHYNFYLYIRNNNGDLIRMGIIDGENSLTTILNLIEHGKFLPNNLLQ